MVTSWLLGDNEVVTMETERERELIPLKVTYLNLLSCDVVKLILFSLTFYQTPFLPTSDIVPLLPLCYCV